MEAAVGERDPVAHMSRRISLTACDYGRAGADRDLLEKEDVAAVFREFPGFLGVLDLTDPAARVQLANFHVYFDTPENCYAAYRGAPPEIATLRGEAVAPVTMPPVGYHQWLEGRKYIGPVRE